MVTKKGTNKNDKLTGSNGDDILYGRGGDDTLDGGKGDDEIVAEDGNDRIYAYATGNHAIDGGKGTDTLDYSKETVGVYVSVNDGHGYGAWSLWIDTFIGVEHIVGSKGGDSINVQNFDDCHGYGGKGDDRLTVQGGLMRGDAGTDTMVGSVGTDEIFWLQRGEGADVIQQYEYQNDTIYLDGDDFNLGVMVGYFEIIYDSSGHDADRAKPQLIFDTTARQLYYDPDGTNSKAAELIATFVNGTGPEWYNFEMV
jgi:Ca2+-binding RTX toxin-like protein